jgi:hypothetical protein
VAVTPWTTGTAMKYHSVAEALDEHVSLEIRYTA